VENMKKLFVFWVIIFVLLTGCRSTGQSQQLITDNGKPGQIQVTLFIDQNNNGSKDAGEGGASDRVLISQDTTCPPTHQESITYLYPDAEGILLIDNLKPGTYCVSYSGDNAVTTRISNLINVSSEQVSQVKFGVIGP
jgi:hypothetical protein